MKFALLVSLLAVGCGPEPLDPRFGGTWIGTSTLSVTGLPAQSSSAWITISTNEDSATFAGVCPNGTGTVTIQGSRFSASWTGSYPCAPVDIYSDCHSVAFTYTSATANLTTAGLSAQGSGTSSGCGTARGFQMAFSGTK